MTDVTFFATPAEFHQWLAANHDHAQVLWVGFHKKDSGIPSITYPEALDEALCFGWIDGVRRSVDEQSYTIRFTPRNPRSAWSVVNIKRANELIEVGRMQPAGLKAFEQHDPAKAQQHADERYSQPLAESYEALFQADARAWRFFQAQAPFYKRSAIWWVMSAKQEATQQRRLAQLIEACAREERMPELLGKAKGSQ
jgi:uncharacterized protein YdeI (YjbR/CyaY-like superfamily)